MTIYFHLGTPKTGTTALQVFLAKNRAKLEEHRFDFPRFLGDTNHVRLAYYGRNNGAMPPNLIEPDLTDEDKIEAFRDRLRKRFSRSIKPDRNYILSNEHWGLMHSPAETERLVSLLTSTGQDVKVIAYFREPCAYLGSMYSTNLKHGGTNDLETPDDRTLTKRYNYLAICDRWAHFIGKENILARLFTKERLHKGDLIDDFLNVVGICDSVASTLERVDEPVNQTLDYLLAGFLLEVNKKLPRIVNDRVNFDRKGLPEICQLLSHRESILVPKKIRDAMHKNLHDDMAEFNRKYLGGEKIWPFAPYRDHGKKLVKVPDQQEMLALFCEIWAKRNKIRGKRLKSLT